MIGRCFVVFIVGCFFATSAAKELPGKLWGGPVVGSVTAHTAKVWIAYSGKGQNAVILGDTLSKRIYYPTHLSYTTSRKGIVSLTMDFTGLEANHQYNIIVAIQGWKTSTRYSFTTQKDTAVSDMRFLFGSCALLNTDVTRIAFPGFSSQIYTSMKKRKADFMVWLGDNVYYLLPKQYNSTEGMFRRNISVRRAFPKYREFVSSTANYAIWDDHDYGPNDSDCSWRLKDSALAVFKSFWPNTYPDQQQFPGNYFSFRYYDAEFFMMDDRTYRAAEGDTTGSFLGETQLIWLKNKLQLSDAAFKFIAIGTQVLNENKFGETYMQYARERRDLLNFISTNNIQGVVFLTGDKHYTEMCKANWGGYPVFDITCSPLTSPVLPRWLFGATKNPTRIPGSDYCHRNFGEISITGLAGNRICKVTIFNIYGKKRREISIAQRDLHTTKMAP
ncbi:MAG: alkaline phosphatase D family protein [Chitinophagales bacterium]